MVRTVLAGEAAPALGPVQRAELLATARGETPEDAIPESEKPAPSLRRRPLWIPSAIAATVMVAAWYAFLHQPLDRFSAMHRATPDFAAEGASGVIAEDPSPTPAEPKPDGSVAANSPSPKLNPESSVSSNTAEATSVRGLTQAKDESAVAFKLQPTPPTPAVQAPASGIQSGTSSHFSGGRLMAGGTAGLSIKDGANSDGDRTTRSDEREILRANPYPVPARPVPSQAGEEAAPYSEHINISGNTRTRDKVLRREIALEPGDVLNQKRLSDARDRLVNANPAPAGAPAEYQPPQIAQNSGAANERATKALPTNPAQPTAAPHIAPVHSFNDKELQADVFGAYQAGGPNTEAYDTITDNPFLTAKENPLSTFSIDVDTASYANVRRFLTSGQLPPKGAVRIEELVNYFHYDYPQPKAGEPFSVNMEVAGCPWAPEHRLLRIGLKGREIPRELRPAANLVFLIDVSGSMMPANKLPLVKESLRLLVDQLGEKDTVSIAVYAGASGTVLEPTHDKAAVREALGHLEAGGSTNGAAGLRLAYQLAKRSFDKEKTNRVILATDGDFNVGTTSQSELVDLITSEAKSGVFLTVLGFGYGNLKDSTMEKLADKGNGNYAYIDTLAEGKKVLVEQMAGTLITIAKDVKIQIEFNPRQVSGYRLIGYENRLLAKEDFNNDKKDAGEIGAGHTVTALYELVPVNLKTPALTTVDPLKYQPKPAAKAATAATPLDAASERTLTLNGANTYTSETRITNDRDAIVATKETALAAELLTLKLRWKAPDADTSTLREVPLTDEGLTDEKSSKDFRWAASVAGFGMILRDSQYKGAASWDTIKELAEEGRGEDTAGYRAEFIQLLEKAASLKP
jgi:Ca-activated chloride channel family protein